MIEIELGKTTCTRCACCGGESTTLTRLVYRDGNAYAIYYASFSTSHPGRVVSAVISMGDWDEDATPAGRRAFALEMPRPIDGRYIPGAAKMRHAASTRS